MYYRHSGYPGGLTAERFIDIIVSTIFHCFDCGINRSISRHHDADRRVIDLLMDVAHQINPAAVRQSQVYQDKVIDFLGNLDFGIINPACNFSPVTGIGHQVRQRFTDQFFVINCKYSIGHLLYSYSEVEPHRPADRPRR